MAKKTATIKKEMAGEMFNVLVALNRAVYSKGAQPDEIMEVAARSLALVRRIDLYPHLERQFSKTKTTTNEKS
jgi:hypothetical protein